MRHLNAFALASTVFVAGSLQAAPLPPQTSARLVLMISKGSGEGGQVACKHEGMAAELARAAQAQPAAGPQALRTTDARHLSGRLGGLASERELLYRIPGQPSMDGNTVDMDLERGEFADNAMRYQVSLTLMNSRIQGLKTALQPE